MTLLAVSCYDDTKLWAGFEELEDRVDALEAKINEQVATLNSVIGALEAKVAVVKVEKNAAGNYVLTFSNNETLEISAADANANNTNLITTVTEDGKTYWAVVGADGKVTKLNAVVHPDTKLLFKVDSETGLLMVSYDGTNYESTGVFVNDDTTFNVVEKFVDAEGYVVLTVGGVEYKLPKVSANHFEILSGMVFFSAGETKSIPVDMEGVVTSMVAKQPSGWTVNLTSKGLEVTAPADASEEGGDDYVDDWGPLSTDVANETYGKIEIWVVTEDGKTLVGSVSVSLEGMFAEVSFAEDKEKGTMVTIEVPTYMEDVYDEETGEVVGQEEVAMYYPVFFGACEADKFDGAALAKTLDYFALGEDEEANPSIFGMYEASANGYGYNWLYERTVSLKDLLGAEPEAGKTYVVWAYNRNADAYSNGADSFILSYYVPTKTTIDVTSVSWNNAELNVSVVGAEEFVLVAAYKEDYEYYISEEGFWNPDYLAMMAQYGMNFTFMDVFLPGTIGGMGLHDFAGEFVKGQFKGKLTELGATSEIAYEYKPEEELVLCVLPLSKFKSENDYTMNDLIVKEFKLNGLATGGSATVTFDTPVVAFENYSVNLTSTGSALTIYKNFTKAQYDNIVAGFETGETMQDYVMENFGDFYQTNKATYEAKINNLTKGTEYTLVAMAIDADGKCGEVVTLPVTTRDYPYDDTNLKVAVKSVTVSEENAKKVTIVYELTGTTKLAVYGNYIGAKAQFTSSTSTATSMEKYVATKSANYAFRVEDTDGDGFVSVEFDNYNPAKYYNYKYAYAVAYTEDANGVTALTHAVMTDASTFNAE